MMKVELKVKAYAKEGFEIEEVDKVFDLLIKFDDTKNEDKDVNTIFR